MSRRTGQATRDKTGSLGRVGAGAKPRGRTAGRETCVSASAARAGAPKGGERGVACVRQGAARAAQGGRRRGDVEELASETRGRTAGSGRAAPGPVLTRQGWEGAGTGSGEGAPSVPRRGVGRTHFSGLTGPGRLLVNSPESRLCSTREPFLRLQHASQTRFRRLHTVRREALREPSFL